ncbi:MAG: GNAT family N-acetyltransferase [Butyrivibrio sp.]|nr:GNAT family N-acetyltransferase [Butyrivibrio sp.]
MSITYRESIDNIDYSELNTLLRQVFGTDKAKNAKHTKKAFINSQNFVFAYDDQKLVGAIRAISDGEWAVIYDIAVSKEYEGTIEKDIIKRLVSQLKGQHIFVNARVGDVGLFEDNGFQRTKTAYTYVGFDGYEKNYQRGYFLPLGYRFENEFFKNTLPFPEHKKAVGKDKIKIAYSLEREGIDYERVAKIIGTAFGRKNDTEFEITKEKVDRTKYLFDISEYVSFAYDGDKLVGVSRAITDGAQEAYIQNVAVDPDYQGYGIGWQVVVNLGEEIQKNGLNPFLHTHPGAVGFYSHKGFLRNKTALDYRNEEEELHPMTPEMEQGFYLPKGYRFVDEL